MHGFVMDLEYVISLELYGVVEDGVDDDAVEGGKKESVNGDDCNVEGKEYQQQLFISPPSPRRHHLMQNCVIPLRGSPEDNVQSCPPLICANVCL